jgi:hypothetical protein
LFTETLVEWIIPRGMMMKEEEVIEVIRRLLQREQ